MAAINPQKVISPSSQWACLFYSCFRVSPEHRAEIDLERGVADGENNNNKKIEDDDFEDWDAIKTPHKTVPKDIENNPVKLYQKEEINNINDKEEVKHTPSINTPSLAKPKSLIKPKQIETNNIQVAPQIAKPKEVTVEKTTAKAEPVPEPEPDFFLDMEPSVKTAVNVIRIEVPKQTPKVETQASSRLMLEENPTESGNWGDNSTLELESEEVIKSDTKKNDKFKKIEATKVNLNFEE